MSVQISTSFFESSTRTQKSQQSLKTRSPLKDPPPGGEDRGGCGTPFMRDTAERTLRKVGNYVPSSVKERFHAFCLVPQAFASVTSFS
jgi:hypothetical protein